MNPEALEAFKKFTQRKGLPQKDIHMPVQMGESTALPCPRVPLSGPLLPWGRDQSSDMSQGHQGPLWVFVAECEPRAVMGLGPGLGGLITQALSLFLQRAAFPHLPTHD